MSNYTYSISTDFTSSGGIVYLSDLQTEIVNSAISSATVLYCTQIADNVVIRFSGALSGGDITILTGIVNAYVPASNQQVLTNTNSFSVYNKSYYLGTGNILQISTGAANGYVLTSDNSGNASWTSPGSLSAPTIPYFNVSANSTIICTSTTPIQIVDLSITPSSGTYNVIFMGSGKCSNSSREFNTQFAKNGTGITASLATFDVSTGESEVSNTYIVSCNGTDVITAQWYISGGAGSLQLISQRSITAIRLGS